MSAYIKILEFSHDGRPMWQRDALRRILLNPCLTDKDIDEIYLLCRKESGLLDPEITSLVAEPLDSAHLPVTPSSSPDVSLLSMKDVRNVNQLDGSKPLSLKPKGLTVIYGDNGAGKSGYTRILKKVCRSRGKPPEIHGNVYAPTTGAPASANIEYDMNSAVHSFNWVAGGAEAPPALKNILVFDSGCASVYVNEENEIAFLPFGLDVLETLSRVCDELKSRLLSEQYSLKSFQLKMPPDFEESPSGLWFASVSHTTNEDEIIQNTSFSDKDEEELSNLDLSLHTNNPIKRANELETKVSRLNGLKERMENAKLGLSSDALEKAKGLLSELKTALEAAEVSSRRNFSSELLEGIGSAAWLELWRAAAAYARTSAYPGKPFPPEEDGARCVLCQQVIDEDAQTRLKRFEKFVADETSKSRIAAQAKVASAIKDLRDISLNIDSPLMDELIAISSETAEAISAFFDSASKRCAAIITALESSGDWSSVGELVEKRGVDISGQIAHVLKEASSMRAAAKPEEIEKMRTKLLELRARKWLYQNRADIQQVVKNKKKIELYNKALDSINTRRISDKSNEITEEFVTEKIRSAFIHNVNALYHKGVSVSLEKSKSSKGVTYYKIKFLTDTKVKVSEVASEGEFKLIALASFFAELSLSSHKSGIVLDDPVTSLDQKIIEQVAKKLVDLAAERQVVVLTHSCFFLTELLSVADYKSIESDSFEVVKDHRGAGIPAECVPWAFKFKRMIYRLRDKCSTAESVFRKQGEPTYRPLGNDLCVELRHTLEKAIEEVLTNGIVERYRRAVQSGKVLSLARIEPEDCAIIDGLMTKYSKIVHSQSPLSPVSIPEPEEIKKDIETLAEWAKAHEKKMNPKK